MRNAHRTSRPQQPLTTRTRIAFSACLVLAGIVLGIGAGMAVYQTNKPLFQTSTLIGSLLCGTGQHVGDAPSSGKGIRLTCLDQSGAEVGPRNNFVALKIALPFMLIFGLPAALIPWMIRRR